MKKQTKEQKIRKMLKNANLLTLKIVILKNLNTKTKYIKNKNILFVNPQVKHLVFQFLVKQKKDYFL
ncbi:hypothetical protein ATP_00474 [Candidatus Phytoplasma mali]|uniref:Uncharacterized protein n=1 Tax=Phytoplasma mali (strain AT) TaxID=482235 RepID=B3R047_PHYMT|nr:hypothetical protein [Candidatus Phytoplasma mali]CAP18211.1 hypothetical protein ATP_00024 [Candidatus Phytoplasma mali]CAP18661.1 hypothetical protein ATP_00474 [Candidatus Phytoplasma mali]